MHRSVIVNWKEALLKRLRVWCRWCFKNKFHLRNKRMFLSPLFSLPAHLSSLFMLSHLHPCLVFQDTSLILGCKTWNLNIFKILVNFDHEIQVFQAWISFEVSFVWVFFWWLAAGGSYILIYILFNWCLFMYTLRCVVSIIQKRKHKTMPMLIKPLYFYCI